MVLGKVKNFIFFYFFHLFFSAIFQNLFIENKNAFLKIVFLKIQSLLIIFFESKIMNKRVTEEKSLPTDFAIAIAEKYKIYHDVEKSDFVGLRLREESLRIFQQMAISSPFEEALLAYYDRNFSDEQLQALKLIYRATSSWLRGEVVGTLLQKIQNTKITNKDFAESISTILEQLENKSENGNKKPTEKLNGLAIKLTQK